MIQSVMTWKISHEAQKVLPSERRPLLGATVDDPKSCLWQSPVSEVLKVIAITLSFRSIFLCRLQSQLLRGEFWSRNGPAWTMGGTLKREIKIVPKQCLHFLLACVNYTCWWCWVRYYHTCTQHTVIKSKFFFLLSFLFSNSRSHSHIFMSTFVTI